MDTFTSFLRICAQKSSSRPPCPSKRTLTTTAPLPKSGVDPPSRRLFYRRKPRGFRASSGGRELGGGPEHGNKQKVIIRRLFGLVPARRLHEREHRRWAFLPEFDPIQVPGKPNSGAYSIVPWDTDWPPANIPRERLLERGCASEFLSIPDPLPPLLF